MKNLALWCALLFCIAQIPAQVGIGTTSPQGALDITSSTNGVVIPRVALTSKSVAAPIVNPQTGVLAEGTLIWNTATTGTGIDRVFPGFYFWHGGQWNVLADGSGKDWSPRGNAGTDPTSNFIGTTDDSDLVFKTNNIQRMAINTDVDPLTGTAGDIAIGDAISGTIKANTELVLRQDNDVFGSSVLRLRNRNGENGAIFETINASAYLVDFLFKTGPSVNPFVSNIRFETRAGSKKIAANGTEFQFGKPDNVDGGPTLVIGANGTGSNSAFRIGNLGIGTVNPTAKLEIDAAAENIPALEIVPRATAPTGTANGQIAVIDNSMYMYDTVRGWLSTETITLNYSMNGSANNVYLQSGGNEASANSGPKMPFNGTIVAITVQSSGGLDNKGFQILRNGGSVLSTFNLNANTYTATTTNIPFNAGDYLNIFVNNNTNWWGGAVPVDNPSVLLFIKWRK